MSEPGIVKTPRQLRAEVEQLIRDDLIGPLAGDEEELLEAPVDRYLLGLLAPRFNLSSPATGPRGENGAASEEGSIMADAQPDDSLAGGSINSDSDEEGSAEDRPPAADQLVPSAFGLTFAVEADCAELTLEASWGAYLPHTSDEKLDWAGRPARVWLRRPCGGQVTIAVDREGPIGPVVPDDGEPEVVVRGIARDREGH